MWVVICCRSDDEWQRMWQAMGHPEWTERPELATGEDRRARHDEIDQMVSSWTRTHDHNEATRILQEAHVPAAPVLQSWEILSNLHLHERGFFTVTPHQEMGAWSYPTFPWKFSRTPASVRMASPLFGEHNRHVYREVFGFGEEELAKLYEVKAVAGQPPAGLPPPPIVSWWTGVV